MRGWMSMKTLSIVSLIVSVFGLVIACSSVYVYASQSDSAIWNIKIQNLSAEKSGKATYVLPNISDTMLSDSKVTFSAPGDSVTFRFDIENLGTLDATLGTVFYGGFQCVGTGVHATKDAKLVCDSLKYTLKYEDGTSAFKNDLLNAGSSRKMELKIVYDSKSNSVPHSSVAVSGFRVVLVYNQNV